MSAVSAVAWERIGRLVPSERVERLYRRFTDRYAALGRRIYWEEDEVCARDAAFLAAYRATSRRPSGGPADAIVRRARALTEFAERVPVIIAEEDLLAGRQAFNGPMLEAREELGELGYACTAGHIVHDYEGMLRRGISGYRAEVEHARARAGTDLRTNLAAFAEALAAFRRYIERHAERAEEMPRGLPEPAAAEWRRRAADLRYLLDHPPATFRQALQMVWFCQVFLHAENPSAAISFGRLDQYLWPFLRDDFARGGIGLQAAFDLVCAFYIKCCEGEESQNAVLGGVDPAGRDATNPLSLIMLAAKRRIPAFQPTLMVRVHADMPPVFMQAACELAAAGEGDPGFMNDTAVIRGLRALAVPLDRARDWGIVGCYEATPQGDCYSNTVAAMLHLVDALADYLGSARAQSAPSFGEFLSGWYDHVRGVYAGQTLPQCQKTWDYRRDHAPSPFGSVLMGGCIESGKPLEAGGARFNFAGINILGIGTAVDSLHAIREVVYDRREVSLAALAAAVAGDFPDETLRMRLRGLPGRYGTDDESTNALARDVSTVLARMVVDSRLGHGVRPYPGFFGFAADIYAVGRASPDGRRKNDLISYGVAPSSAVGTPPTAAMRSAAHVAQDLAACGNPLSITLQPADVVGQAGVDRVRQLVEGYFALGGSHVHVNVTTADELRRAKAEPEKYASLTVRVSGYSARFVTVDAKWQDALIERAERDR